MTIPFNIGVLQLSMEPVQETVAMAKACEQAGFDAFWIAEAYPWWRKHSFEARSSTAVLAVIAAHTTRIQLGWGIISPYTRHPVQIAMEARVMQDLAGDRFLLGLGASKIFMKEIGDGEGEKSGRDFHARENNAGSGSRQRSGRRAEPITLSAGAIPEGRCVYFPPERR